MTLFNIILVGIVAILLIATFVYSAKYDRVSRELADVEIERDSLKEELEDSRYAIDIMSADKPSFGVYEIQEQTDWFIPAFIVLWRFAFCGKDYSAIVKSFPYIRDKAESRDFARREAEELLAALNEKVTWQDDMGNP